MTTRTLTQKQYTNTLAVVENNAVSGDPTSSGAVANVNAGGQWQYDGNTGPNATGSWHGQLALTAGALTVDLTSIVDAILGTVSFSGKKLLHFQAWTPASNAGAMDIAPGASNGYAGWTTGLILGKGDTQTLGPLNGTTAIDGTHKTIDFSGTGTDVVNLVMLFG